MTIKKKQTLKEFRPKPQGVLQIKRHYNLGLRGRKRKKKILHRKHVAVRATGILSPVKPPPPPPPKHLTVLFLKRQLTLKHSVSDNLPQKVTPWNFGLVSNFTAQPTVMPYSFTVSCADHVCRKYCAFQ